MEDAQFRFMQSMLAEIKIMNDRLLDIKKELSFKNDMEYPLSRNDHKETEIEKQKREEKLSINNFFIFTLLLAYCLIAC